MPAEKTLIVEDEQSVMGFIKSNLDQMGYPIASTASTGEETVETGQNSYHATNLRMREAVHPAEGHYRNLIENTILGAFHLDCSERFIAVNPAFAKILGYASPEELQELAPDAKMRFVNPECREELLDSLRKHGYVKDFEFQVYRKDGSKIWLAQTTRALYDVYFDEPYFEGIVQDISERKREEDMMHAMMARQVALLAAVPDIIMEVDTNKVYTWANSAGIEFFGDDVIGKEASCYFAGDQDTYKRVDPLFKGSGDLFYLESWQRRKDGSKRLLGWRCHVLKDHSGKVTGALSSARDITQEKLAAQENLRTLTRSVLLNQLQRDLLGTGELSHKLKTITDGIVDIFEADFCRIWIKSPGDLCELGCVHAAVQEGPNVCRDRDKCLRLIASSGRYIHTNGNHQRVPFGAYKVGHIASGKEHMLLTNDMANDSSTGDHGWAKSLGLMSFAGFQLHSSDEECIGVLECFSTHAIAPEEQAQLDALSGAASQVILSAQAQSALRQSEERFRLIAETIDEVFWMTDVAEKRMLYISPAFERIWGLSRRVMYENREAFRKTLHPEDLDRMIEFLKIQESGQPYDSEYRIIRPDGSVRQIWDRGFPIKDGNGGIRFYVGVAQDVTSWKNAERKHKEAKDYLHKIINCIADPIFVKDRQHRFVLVNDAICSTLGMPAEELVGTTSTDHMRKDVLRTLFKEEDCVFETGRAVVSVDEVIGANGEKYTFMASKNLLTNANGDKQVVGVLRDITEFKRAEKERAEMEIQLRQAQKLEAIGQLAAGIAHEINTPIQYISDNTRFLQDTFRSMLPVLEAYARLLQAGRDGKMDSGHIAEVEKSLNNADLEYLIDETPKALTQSLEGLNRVATIVRAMKEFSHPGGEEKQTIDLNHAIENTVTVCRNEWKYVAEVAMDLDPALPLVPCLPGDLNQVTLNLVVNAAHAIAEANSGNGKHKGTIRISTRRDGDWVEIRIGDTGTGIPEEHRGKIFTPFFTTKEVGKGTGQGLAISRAVVVGKHRGTISFETEVGKGTTFIIRLPLESQFRECEIYETADSVC